MIPLRLSLQNFLSYGEAQTLDFNNFDLAVLSGDNGVGKSSLLEAITWAIWGKTRALFDDDLTRKGSGGMWVELIFETEKNIYRILRKREKKGKTSVSVLEFQIAQNRQKNLQGALQYIWKPLTEPSIRETQEKITKTLRLSYDVFVNSSYLRQGHADEFTIKKPTERKEALGEILGFSYYEELTAKAKEKLKSIEQEEKLANFQLEELKKTLGNKDEVKKTLKEINHDKEIKQRNYEIKKKEFEQLAEKKKRNDLLEQETKFLRERYTILVREYNQNLQHEKTLKEKLKEYQAIVGRKIQIEEKNNELGTLHRAEDHFNQILKNNLILKTKEHELEKQIVNEKHKLEMELGLLRSQIKQSEDKIKTKEMLEKNLRNFRSEIEKLERIEILKQKIEKQITENTLGINKIETENEQLEGILLETQNKKHLVSQAKAKCPLCEQNLTTAHAQKLMLKFKSETASIEKKIKQNKTKIFDLDNEKKKKRIEHKELEIVLNQKQTIERKITENETFLGEILKIEMGYHQLLKSLKNLENNLEKKNYASELQITFAKLQKEIKKLQYDVSRHQKIKEKIAKLAPWEKEKNELAVAEAQIKEIQKQLAESRKQIQVRHQERQDIEKKGLSLAEELKNNKPILEKFAETEQSLRMLENELIKMEGDLRIQLEKQKDLEVLEKERDEKEKELRDLFEKKNFYTTISEAFGKKGIQAMIIEEEIPHIEEEANFLLAKITDGRMKIKIETKRTKKGSEEEIETLDIQIADELGIRNYEMYSGGEAFRINFAIRIALSKLLSFRAGTKLRFLAIDEGFGTLDAAGQEDIIAAINSIKNDFSKIIIVTHLGEIRDVFPSRINVYKDSGGSRIAMQ